MTLFLPFSHRVLKVFSELMQRGLACRGACTLDAEDSILGEGR